MSDPQKLSEEEQKKLAKLIELIPEHLREQYKPYVEVWDRFPTNGYEKRDFLTLVSRRVEKNFPKKLSEEEQKKLAELAALIPAPYYEHYKSLVELEDKIPQTPENIAEYLTVILVRAVNIVTDIDRDVDNGAPKRAELIAAQRMCDDYRKMVYEMRRKLGMHVGPRYREGGEDGWLSAN